MITPISQTSVSKVPFKEELVNPQTKPNEQGPQNRENKNIMLWASLAGLGTLGAVGLVYLVKRGKGGKEISQNMEKPVEKPIEQLKEMAIDEFKKAGNKFEKGIAKLASGENYTGKITHELKSGKNVVMEYKDGILQESVLKEEGKRSSVKRLYDKTTGKITAIAKCSEGKPDRTIAFYRYYPDGSKQYKGFWNKGDPVLIEYYEGIYVPKTKIIAHGPGRIARYDENGKFIYESNAPEVDFNANDRFRKFYDGHEPEFYTIEADGRSLYWMIAHGDPQSRTAFSEKGKYRHLVNDRFILDDNNGISSTRLRISRLGDNRWYTLFLGDNRVGYEKGSNILKITKIKENNYTTALFDKSSGKFEIPQDSKYTEEDFRKILDEAEAVSKRIKSIVRRSYLNQEKDYTDLNNLKKILFDNLV